MDDLALAGESPDGNELDPFDVSNDSDPGHPNRNGAAGCYTALMCRLVDEGLPIAYEVLERGVPVFASDQRRVGTVDRVVSAPEVDIFHGIVIRSDQGQQFVAADQIASLHERGVDLRLDAVAVRTLPAPAGGALAWRVREPGVKPSRWKELLDLVTGSNPRRGNWREED